MAVPPKHSNILPVMSVARVRPATLPLGVAGMAVAAQAAGERRDTKEGQRWAATIANGLSPETIRDTQAWFNGGAIV